MCCFGWVKTKANGDYLIVISYFLLTEGSDCGAETSRLAGSMRLGAFEHGQQGEDGGGLAGDEACLPGGQVVEHDAAQTGGQGAEPDDQDGDAFGQAFFDESMREMLLVGVERALALKQTDEGDACNVIKRDGQNDQRHEDGVPGTGA